MLPVVDQQWPRSRELSQGTFVLWLFGATATLAGTSCLLTWSLISLFPGQSSTTRLELPSAFVLSSLLLFVNSVSLHKSRRAVRRERQVSFRRWLLVSLATGTLFIGVQGYGLWWLLGAQSPEEVQTGAGSFVFVLSFLHGLHVTVAMMFLVFVTLRGLTDRYDHEYFWGVTVCAFFWDVLGIVWLGILAVFVIAV